jgi:dihydrofolate reductase
MSKVLWHITMSLDGFIAARDYSTEWMFEHGSAGPMGREVMERTGAILAGSIEQAIATARETAGTKDVGVFGADLAGQCISAGLVDEIFVHLVPVLLGDGLRLFSVTGTAPVKLRKTRCDDAGQITDLGYEVLR